MSVGLKVGVRVRVGLAVRVPVGVRLGVTDAPPVGSEVVGLGVGTHKELLTVVLLKVIAAVCAITLPSSTAPPPGKVTAADAKTVPTNDVVPLNVAAESTFQNT